MELVFFFTRGVSLKTWVDKGLFSREKEIFEKYLEQGLFSSITWVTFGGKDHEVYKNLLKNSQLDKRISISAPKGFFGSKAGRILFFLFFPILNKSILRKATFFRTNQLDGVLLPLYCKIFFPAKLYLRSGWLHSRNAKGWRRFYFNFIENLGYKNACFASVSNESDFIYLQKKYANTKIMLLGNYINTSRFNILVPSENRESTFLFVGNISNEKNIKLLVELFSGNEMGCYHIYIYGRGPLLKFIEDFIISRNLENIHLMGEISNDQLPKVYNRHKFYIQISPREGMPKTVLEAMACGCVCFCSNIDGFSQIIDHNQTGLILQDLNRKTLLALTKKTQKELQTISENAAKKIEDNYSIVNYIQKEKRIYEAADN
ncbi:MAG: glycosyltransferase [Ferruginibacter sp.]